jgi:hypothetical protein
MLEVAKVFCPNENKATVNARDQPETLLAGPLELLLDSAPFLVTAILNHPIRADSHKNNILTAI